MTEISGVQNPSNLVRLLGALSGSEHADADLRQSVDNVLRLIEGGESGEEIFLSVILRTQGRRIEAFRDALLCLYGQTDQSFEIVVVDHDSDEIGAEEIRVVVAEQPASLRGRITVLEVKGGSRSRPLNAALEQVRGQYVAVYDDDDIVFANWVEEFHRAAERARGRMLRSVVATQQVVAEHWPRDQDGFRAMSWPKAEYPVGFDQLAHLRVNYSPFMSWAFPHQLFTQFGFRFDEELLVCEDWDMILRGSLLCGVEEISELTAIYRRWQGRDSSYTIHSQEEWRASEQRVIDKLNASVLLLGAGTVPEVRWMLENIDENDVARMQLHGLVHSRAWRLARPIRGAMRVYYFARRRAGRVVRAALNGHTDGNAR